MDVYGDADVDGSDVVVYCMEQCVPCDMLCECLRDDVPYLKVDIRKHPALRYRRNVHSVPVCHVKTVTGIEQISGYGPDEEAQLLRAIASLKLRYRAQTIDGDVPIA